MPLFLSSGEKSSEKCTVIKLNMPIVSKCRFWVLYLFKMHLLKYQTSHKHIQAIHTLWEPNTYLPSYFMPEPIGISVPKFSSVAIEQISTYNHQSMALTCPAQSSPSPAFRWNLHHFYKIPALEPIGGSTPKFSSDATENILAHSDRTLSMACPAQASPVPTFRWSWPFKR